MKFSKFKEISAIGRRLSFVFVFAIAMMGLNMPSAHAALAGKGLIHPVNKFPTWFSDTNGVTLQLCR